MSDINPENPPKNDPPTLDSNQLRDVLGDELDARLEARGLTEDRIARLDRLDILDSLESTFEGIFTKHSQGSNVDKAGLLKDIGSLIDSKLAGLKSNETTVTTEGRKSGPLGRWLSANLGGS